MDEPYDLTYTAERFTAELPAKDYIARFRNADYFLLLCQQCRNYGRRYGCPPFEEDTLAVIGHYERTRIIGIKISPNSKNLPLNVSIDLMTPVIEKLNQELLETERQLKGRAFGFVGNCPYCGGAPCQRIAGKPCLHPDKVRPSLEAYGFDISLTAKELLGIDIKWSKGGAMPEYLTLVCGIFY